MNTQCVALVLLGLVAVRKAQLVSELLRFSDRMRVIVLRHMRWRNRKRHKPRDYHNRPAKKQDRRRKRNARKRAHRREQKMLRQVYLRPAIAMNLQLTHNMYMTLFHLMSHCSRHSLAQYLLGSVSTRLSIYSVSTQYLHAILRRASTVL